MSTNQVAHIYLITFPSQPTNSQCIACVGVVPGSDMTALCPRRLTVTLSPTNVRGTSCWCNLDTDAHNGRYEALINEAGKRRGSREQDKCSRKNIYIPEQPDQQQGSSEEAAAAIKQGTMRAGGQDIDNKAPVIIDRGRCY
ncbi:hypothetical protein Pmani_016102 [Petrolisthes manimaculis]|uniref:Uncharacterized protein n=1 Tax=Petrolisthes manimaculis TaxID=1843537 RepID=A0AAE1PPR8_9EUCA|nr:hypothetical protein Pmani_016102 [Petrolisthes manimaculis]